MLADYLILVIRVKIRALRFRAAHKPVKLVLIKVYETFIALVFLVIVIMRAVVANS